MQNVSLISGLSVLAPDFDAVVCDVWGVLHNGVVGYAAAGKALEAFRATGKPVILLTNAPRPAEFVAGMLDRFGISRGAYDAIVTSGDVCRALLEKEADAPTYHLGPERDRNLFDGLKLKLVGEADARIVVCTGLFNDDVETAEDYRDQLTAMAARGLRFYCPNPDIVVERGHALVYCAGALAQLYADLGGEVVMVGKPHPAVYAAALTAVEARLGRAVSRSAVLAIGDALPTDVRGGFSEGLGVLMVTAGIHAADFGDADKPDMTILARRLAVEGIAVTAAIARLAW